jgi:hypothetical protein
VVETIVPGDEGARALVDVRRRPDGVSSPQLSCRNAVVELRAASAGARLITCDPPTPPARPAFQARALLELAANG